MSLQKSKVTSEELDGSLKPPEAWWSAYFLTEDDHPRESERKPFHHIEFVSFQSLSGELTRSIPIHLAPNWKLTFDNFSKLVLHDGSR